MFLVLTSFILSVSCATEYKGPLLPTAECIAPVAIQSNVPTTTLPEIKKDAQKADSSSNEVNSLKKKIDEVLYSSIEVKKTKFCGMKYYINHFTGACEWTRLCQNNTISFNQPADTNWGYEGKCGITAAANATTMLCGALVTPNDMQKFEGDITPGWRPSTMRSALNDALKSVSANSKFGESRCPRGEWRTSVSDDAETHFLRIKNSPKPLADLLFIGPLSVHWVTIISTRGESINDKDCAVNYNDAGTNSTVTCKVFINKSESLVGKYYFVGFHPQ